MEDKSDDHSSKYHINNGSLFLQKIENNHSKRTPRLVVRLDTGPTENQVTGSSLRSDNILTFYRRDFKILTLDR